MSNEELSGRTRPVITPVRPGGRLRLLATAELTDAQQELHRDLVESRGQHGYAITDEEGRLIGSFNALLRIPAIASTQLRWAAAISCSDIDSAVREAVILVIASRWRSPYMLYAHRRAAQNAGLATETIAALTSGSPLEDDSDLSLAADLALQVVATHGLTDETYRRCVDRFGEATLAAMMTLIGQYLTTAALLTCFDVPAPEPAEEGTP